MIAGNARTIAMNIENTTEQTPTTKPITTSAFGARLSLTQ
jgi:hypothetical protein